MKAVLFDAGNTLIWLDHAYISGLLAAHGHPRTEDELLAAEYPARVTLDELMRNGQENTDEERGRIYFGEVFRHLGVPREALPAIATELYARHKERNLWCVVREGTDEALATLRARGYRLGVISNSDGRVEGILESVGLLPHFEFVIDSKLVGIEKPDPRIFHLGCERMGLAPEETTYVGDLYEIDVRGARAAGMRAVLVDPLDRFGDRDCDRVRTLAELPAVLEAA